MEHKAKVPKIADENVFDFVDNERLNDRLADELTRCRHKNTLHYFCGTNTSELEVEVHFFSDPACKTGQYVIIEDSHNHVALFLSIRAHILQQGMVSDYPHVTYFPKLSMKGLNDIVAGLHRGDAAVDAVRKDIGPDYPLPKRFFASLVGHSEQCVSVMDARTVRCVTHCPDEARSEHTSCRFRVLINEACDSMDSNACLPLSLFPQQARRFELSRGLHASWPMDFENPKEPNLLNQPTVIAIDEDLGLCLHRKFQNHVALIAGVPPDTSLYKYLDEHPYRYKGQKQSKHAPLVHGRTLYGHCLQDAKDVGRFIADVVFKTYNATRLRITTADIALHW